MSPFFLTLAVSALAVGEKHFWFVALPFSLSMACQVFTKVLAPVLMVLSSQGIHIVEYLDYLLLKEHSAQALCLSTDNADISKLQGDVHLPEVCIRSDSLLDIPGVSLGHNPGLFFSHQERVLNLHTHVWIFCSKKLPQVRFYMRVLSLMVASFEEVMFAQFHFNHLQFNLLTAWNKIPQSLDWPRISLAWWLTSPVQKSGKSILSITWMVLTTSQGWRLFKGLCC